MARKPLRLLILVIIAVLLLFTLKLAANQDVQDVGARAHDLRKGPFGVIFVEIDSEVVLDQSQVDRFTNFIERYTGKGTFLNLQTVVTGAPSQVTEQEAIGFARNTRNTYSSPLVFLAIHVLVLNSELSQTSCTILCATVTAAETFDATEMVVYGRSVSNAVVATVMSHEFGHMMGLCGIAMPDPQNICDGSGHARDSQSLMAPVLNTDSTWVQSLTLMSSEVMLLDEV